MVETDGGVLQAERAARHDRVQEFGDVVVVHVRDLKGSLRGAEQVVHVRDHQQHRDRDQPVRPVLQRDDQRLVAAVAEHEPPDKIGAAVPEKAATKHFDLLKLKVGSVSECLIKALCDERGVPLDVLKWDRKLADLEQFAHQRGTHWPAAGKFDGHVFAPRRGLAQGAKRVVDWPPRAGVDPPYDGVEVGDRKIGLVTAFHLRPIRRLDRVPQVYPNGKRRIGRPDLVGERMNISIVESQPRPGVRNGGGVPTRFERPLRAPGEFRESLIEVLEGAQDPRACQFIAHLIGRCRRDHCCKGRKFGFCGQRHSGGGPTRILV